LTPTSELQALNERFAHLHAVEFGQGAGGLVIANIANRHADAVVSLHGGHVLAFQPRGEKPVLWMSRQSHYAAGKPIRGGIPLCWPWFGPHPVDTDKPAHGFARLSAWDVVDVTGGNATRLVLALRDSEATRALWPHAFRLELAVTAGRDLDVELAIHNPGPDSFTCTDALHTYFAVSDIAQVRIEGLDGATYLDKVAGYERREQAGAIAVDAETDRVYLETTGDCTIADAGWRRTIRVAKRGSGTTVVWNPWVERSRQLQDFGDDEYHEMVCVETANAADDRITVPPGGTHRLAARLSIEAKPTSG
jgi:glucose-6-phosphate 1-epimerase